MPRYEQLRIWTNNIGRDGEGTYSAERERLRTSYRQLWSNAVTMSREIQRDLPQLTLHDEAHFEALWDRADQIAGQDYRLTPLEVFVLGGAIVLHDSANSLAAFSGGLAEVQAMPEWRDAMADWIDRHGHDATESIPEDAQRDLMLETLRSVHAERARSLASFEVTVGDERHALLQDDQLRTHIGPLIGEIAASHHWGIATLKRRLGTQKGSLAGMPSNWTVRPVMLACLLRCADATQLDQDRAPDFLYGLLQMRGLSEKHWRAQNRLAHPHIDPQEPSALVFTSTRTFGEHEAQAWWIAHDAIGVANRELQAANSLIRDARLPAFQVNRIRGAESPESLSEYLTIEGWRPVSAEVKVSRVDKIVDMFGGEQLYGNEMAVPVRELIQNAADAIRFRRELEPPSSDYEGRIVVRLREIGSNGEVLLIVEDDGMGMSEDVMTGPLIDFGASYISSSLVKSERPGLLSKGRKRIGKFGIGFFSIFMLTDKVEVTSRPFDSGLGDCRTLRFSGGAVTRPVLLDRKPVDFSSTCSTRVTLTISRDKLSEVLLFDSRPDNRIYANIHQLVGALCPMLDVNVHVDDAGRIERVHSTSWYENDRAVWLKRILLLELKDWPGREEDIQEAAARLTFVDVTDPSAGFAAVSGVARCGVAAVGTLRATQGLSQFEDRFVGAIDFEPAGPRREAKIARAHTKLGPWASEQAKLAASKSIPLPKRQIIAQRVAAFGGDASSIASIMFNGEWMSLENAFAKTHKTGAVYIPVTRASGSRIVMTRVRERHDGLLQVFRPGELDLLVATMEGGELTDAQEYFSIPTHEDAAECSFLAMFDRLAELSGMTWDGEFIERIEFARYIGRDSSREDLYHGRIIASAGLKLTLRSK